MIETFATSDAERSVLGSILMQPAALRDVLPILGETADAFRDPLHAKVWQTMLTLRKKGEPIDVVSVASQHLDDYADVSSYIRRTLEDTGTWAHAGAHARRIQESYARRMFASNARAMVRDAETAESIAEACKFAREALEEIQAVGITNPTRSLAVSLRDSLVRWQTETPRRVLSPWPSLDVTTGGFGPGQLVILAALTSRGKTSMAMQMAEHVVRQGLPAVVFSLEMGEHELNERLVSAHVSAGCRAVREETRIDPDLGGRVERAVAEIAGWPLIWETKGNMTVAGITSRAMRHHAASALGLVVVDYLGLVKGQGTLSRNDFLGNVTGDMKALAQELECPVLLLSQLSRESAKQARPPDLHDLRDSGNIEQDADVVIMLHRPVAEGPRGVEEPITVYVRKNRSGPTGECSLTFRTTTTRFTDGGMR